MTTTRRLTKLVRAAALAWLAATTACTTVAPYERGKLAHPTMAVADGPGMGAEHLRAVTEGATGASLGAGSGCGCN